MAKEIPGHYGPAFECETCQKMFSPHLCEDCQSKIVIRNQEDCPMCKLLYMKFGDNDPCSYCKVTNYANRPTYIEWWNRTQPHFQFAAKMARDELRYHEEQGGQKWKTH